MMAPPYRLTTVTQVQEYMRGKRDSLSQSLLAFAQGNRIEPPPLVSSLPERIELPVYDVREEYRHEFVRLEGMLEQDFPFAIFDDLKTKYRNLIDHLPLPYDAAINEMLPVLQDLLPRRWRMRESATAAIVDPDITPIAASMTTRTFFHILNAYDW